MSSRLDRFLDLAVSAREAHYHVHILALRCHVSPRQLQRYIRKKTGFGAGKWLSIQRQKLAYELLSSGKSVKEVAIMLDYTHVTHFSRDFKRFYGISPHQVHKLRF
jgi:AraC-like DNA-binding protein